MNTAGPARKPEAGPKTTTAAPIKTRAGIRFISFLLLAWACPSPFLI